MAVDDSERAAPATRAVALSKPMAKRIAAIAAKVMRTCNPPSPKTRRRMVFNRSKDSSSPMRKRRKTTPSSPIWAMLSR